MTLRCEQIDDLLLEGDAFSMDAAARHAETCDACREQLAAWNDLSATAQSLQTTWQNDMLWPRIDRAIQQEKRQNAPMQWWRVAAAILLTVGLAAATFYAARLRTRDAAYEKVILQSEAMDVVERAQHAHAAAIAALEDRAEAKLEDAESPLMVSYREKLMLLDDAIAECEANIQSNRQNAHLRKQLLAMYSEKQKTLQDALREETTNASHDN